MSQWYISKNGQALGPMTQEQVIALIESGDVKEMDLVYEAGATEWMPLAEVESFSKYFNKSQDPNPAGEGAKDWVILKKVQSEKGQEYKQMGPFSVEQVLTMLDAGDIQFVDFAWKKGMESWVKVNDLKEFSQPLPSSPDVDTSIYEKTQSDLDVKTLTDAKQKASLTHLVNIERFDHEKTMVQPSSKTRDKATGAGSEKSSAEDEPVKMPDLSQTAMDTEIDDMTPIPINEDGFVTESGVATDGLETSESGISLWSLEPPSQNKKTQNSDFSEETQVVSQVLDPEKNKVKPSKKPKKKNKKKKEVKVKKTKRENSSPALSTESLQWIGAVAAVILAFVFFYLSFQVDGGKVVYDENSQYINQQQPSQQAFKQEEIPSKMSSYKQAIEQARESKPQPVAFSKPRLPKEVVNKLKPVPAPSPKVPLEEKVRPRLIKRQAKKMSQTKKVTVKPVQTKRVQAKSTRERELAAKTKVLKKRAHLMKASKRKEASPAKKIRPKKINSTPKKTPGVAVASGGRKSQSFYKQRDRLALFYTSLKAETLAVEIARQYRKLKGNKSAWAAYYGQWRKKVRAAVAKDIRQFPKANETYAYPKILSSFKKDYQLFYKYGESFDAKVKGARAPSGAPSNMRTVFSRYKSQAQRLGR